MYPRVSFAVALEQCLVVSLVVWQFFCSFLFVFGFSFVGAGFDSPVTFDMLVHPRFWRTVVV